MSNRSWGFVDFRLHLSGLAWQVLHALEGEPTFAAYDKEKGEYKVEVETYAFYNGRERGFTLHMTHPDRLFRGNLYISFAQNRSSDSISVYHWRPEHKGLNPPVPNDLTDAGAWDTARHCKTVDEAVAYIQEIARKFLAEEEKLATVQEVLAS